MLIRFATEKDLPAWYALATEVSPIFRHPADMGMDGDYKQSHFVVCRLGEMAWQKCW
jgi:hypothetical protein